MIIPDPLTPEGAAVIDLHEQMEDLENRTGEWPGAEVVDILGPWLADFDFTRVPAPARCVAGSAWVLRRQDRHEDVVTLWTDEASALASLAQHARANWDNVWGGEGIPDSPPASDRRAVDLYYGPKDERGDEDYWLYADDIGRLASTMPEPDGFRFPGEEFCAQANSTAVFHPMTGPDDDGLPCIEAGGVLVFAYLDPDMEAVRVSVDLDTAVEQLVRGDATIPLHVEVGNATVFSAGSRAVPAKSRAGRMSRLADWVRWMCWWRED
ncbi:hypothetical protein [Streptomyces sp. AC555_RSS877]|uniref:hypothetical protein n=1 Tax=Streptomyces sp. AC555_RSS877 TaxID=2823688 RepID=UPI001C269C6D|nr:hypothetical protein [Streptomyces sp. AC555_RSS877]